MRKLTRNEDSEDIFCGLADFLVFLRVFQQFQLLTVLEQVTVTCRTGEIERGVLLNSARTPLRENM